MGAEEAVALILFASIFLSPHLPNAHFRMASLRLTFPEKDQPTVIALTGARLTIGRLPFNTIQIIDRTISGFHAELISEHGHYRLHDRGSSNGTYVNGQRVSDYHLNEAC